MVDSTGTTTYTYNAGNRLTLITDPSSNLTTNTYDNSGNLTVTNANGTVTTNTWTYDNRLRAVTLATPATTTFTYDGDGLRRQTVTAAGTTNFIWDGQDVLLETDVSNNTQVTYTQTPNLYGNLVSQRRSTTTTFYHHDALGSTLALTDTNENVTDTYLYYAFGGLLTSTGNTVNNLRFVGNLGYYNEAALALQYLRARYYEPGSGRFISVDPVRDGLNWYVYVSNSPVNMVDPSGLKKPPKPKPCNGDGDGDERPCRVVMWQGDTSFWGIPGIPPMAQEILAMASRNTKQHLENPPYVGYRVEIMTYGKLNDLRKANKYPDLVGIATGSHGSCGYQIWGGYCTTISTYDDKSYVACDLDPPPGYAHLKGWERVKNPEAFVAAYAGHCYSSGDWFTDLIDPPSVDLCRQIQGLAMGIPTSKVWAPSSFLPGGYVMPDAIFWDFWYFWKYFPYQCPLLNS